MANNKRPRRAYRPRFADLDPIGLAMSRAGRFSAAEVKELTNPADTVLAKLRQGQGDMPAWEAMADYTNLAEALVEVGIGTNLGPDVDAAQQALSALIKRAQAGRGWTLYPTELAAFVEAIDVYHAQIQICSRGEHLRAIEIVQRRVSGALAGNGGNRTVVHARPEDARPR